MSEHSEEKIFIAQHKTQSSIESRFWEMRFQRKKKEGTFLKKPIDHPQNIHALYLKSKVSWVWLIVWQHLDAQIWLAVEWVEVFSTIY